MMRSLFAGVSGLKNHQVKMDVIGNNIANINTVGFKAGRVTFQESLNQTIKDATRAHSGKGGINPQQVGLGMSIGSIDTLFTQGNLETTGNSTDLAIQGDAFFVLSDGVGEYYGRAGNFVVDGEGRLVAPKNGYVVQGKMADESGKISSGSQIQDIVLPFGQKSPARATTQIDYQCNLDSNTRALEQVWSADFSKKAQISSSAAFATVDASTNNTIELYTNDAGSAASPVTITIDNTSATALDASELVARINAGIADTDLQGKLKAEVASVGTGEGIRLATVDTGGSDTYISLTANNLLLNSANVASSQTEYGTRLADATAVPAILDTELNDLPAVVTDLTDGDTINITGTNAEGKVVSEKFTYNTASAHTIQDLLTAINDAFTGSTATLDSDGSILLTDSTSGETQTTVTLTFTDDNSGSVMNVPNFSDVQTGRDAGEHTASITVYDSKGATHIVSLTFTNQSTDTSPNVWSWEAAVDNGDITPTAGDTGQVRFNNDGSLAVFTVTDAQPLTFDPENGSETVSITLNGGNAGSLAGITQLDSPTTTVAKNQDGYGMGNLQTISIAENGEITGHFSNGVSQNLAQIVLAKFNNPAGLLREGDNMYKVSANSGTAVKGTIGGGVQASLASGALEMSNVDLAEEFTDMIVAQRGFQANSRVITTADTLLDEITRLKR